MTGAGNTLAGRVLDGRYELEVRIGRGGMGEVYRARHLLMEQPVAVKVLRPDLAADPSAAKRFVREARTTFRMDHPGCVRVTDFGATDDGLLYLVMEYLDGRTAGDELRVDGAMAAYRVAHIGRQVCEALDHAHGLGLIHRDLKPDNLMLIHRDRDPDRVKVLDFGLAKLVTGPGGHVTAAFSMALTGEGMVFGTAEYMSPEQAMGEPLTPLTDIYSLGMVCYELLTNALPFHGASVMEMLAMQVREPPAPVLGHRPDTPPELAAVIMQCLAKDPDERPAGARALGNVFAELENALPAPRSKAARVATHVAASSTVDMDSDAILSAADAVDAATTVSTASATPGPARPAHWTAPPATLPAPAVHGLHQVPPTSEAVPPTSEAVPPTSEAVPPTSDAVPPTSGTAPAMHGPRPVPPTSDAVPPTSGTRRWPLLAAGILGLGALAGVAALVALPAPSSEAPAQTTQLPEITDDQPVPAAGRPTTPAPAPADGHPDALPPALPDAAPDARTEDPGARPSGNTLPGPVRRQVSAHLKAAEEARRAGNLLKQMAEADSALRLDPKNRQAAYLLGDALVQTDPARGCRYLRRAGKLRQARAALRRAGCDRTD